MKKLFVMWLALMPTMGVLVGQIINNGSSGGGGSNITTPVSIANGGTGTGSTLTGFVRGGNPLSAAELSGDCTTNASFAIVCTKTNGNSFTAAAYTATGTSGAAIPLLNGANTWSGEQTFSSSGAAVAMGGNSITFNSAWLCYYSSGAVQLGSGGCNTSGTLWAGTVHAGGLAVTNEMFAYGYTGNSGEPGISFGTGTGTLSSSATNSVGTITSGTAGTITFTMTWANGVAYTHRAVCSFRDETTPADVIGTVQTTAPTTTTLTASGTTASGDIVSYLCMGY